MGRAKESALDALHAKVAKVITEALEIETVPVFDDEGEKVGERKIKPSPQMLAQAIKFLKDNGIDAPAKSQRMNDLAAALADLDELEAATELRPN